MDLDATAAATTRKVDWVREAAGSRLPELELCMQVFCMAITDRQGEADASSPSESRDATCDEA